ncbi:MAG TPA: hypothetical protein VFS21_27500 [Roseiflexaceae bacterium]|nr:hypothetical protein [Roseiflexaceae bacterium]
MLVGLIQLDRRGLGRGPGLGLLVVGLGLVGLGLLSPPHSRCRPAGWGAPGASAGEIGRRPRRAAGGFPARAAGDHGRRLSQRIRGAQRPFCGWPG